MHFRVPKFIGEAARQAVHRVVVHLGVHLEDHLEVQTFLAGSFREVSYLEASFCGKIKQNYRIKNSSI